MPQLTRNAAAFEYEDRNQKAEQPSIGERVKGKLSRPNHDKFPYRDNLWRRFCSYLLSRRFQIALQLTLGVLFASLFVVVKQLKFVEACVGCILVLAGMCLVSPHPHVGCLLLTVSIFLWVAAYIIVYAGAIASLAYACGRGRYAGTLVAFSLVGFVPIAGMRAAPGNPGPGILSAIMYGITIIFTIPRTKDIITMWKVNIAFLMAAITVAAAGIMLAGTLVLPSLAGHQLQDNLAMTLKGLGRRLSALSSFIVSSDEEKTNFSNPDAPKSASYLRMHDGNEEAESEPAEFDLHAESLKRLKDKMRVPEIWSSEAEFFHEMNKRTDPKAPNFKYNLDRHIPDIHRKVLRQRLDECKLLMLESTFEPLWFQRGPLLIPAWGKVLADIRSLLTRINSLALLVEGGRLFHSKLLVKECGVDPIPSIGVVLAEICCVCGNLSSAIEQAGKPAAGKLLTNMPWQEIKMNLAEIVKATHRGYLKRHQDQHTESNETEIDGLETRVLLLLVMLINGIISAVATLENSLPAALGYSTSDLPKHAPRISRSQRRAVLKAGLTESIKRPTNNNTGDVEMTAAGAHNTDVSQDILESYHLMEFEEGRSDAVREVNGHVDEDKTSTSDSGDVKIPVKDEDSKAAKQTSHRLTFRQHISFLQTFLEMVTGIALYRRFKPIFWDETIKAFSSWAVFKEHMRRKRVQYMLKFFFTPMSVLSIAVAVESNYPYVAKWRLYYAYITSVIVCIEKVEAVVWKTVQRIMGTLVGGTLAYLIMLRGFIQHRGAAVDALVLTSVFVIANRLDSQFKYSVFLTMITLMSLTYCQFGKYHAPGDDFHSWIERVSNITAACLWVAAVSWLVLPWYASDSQLLLIADAYVSAAETMQDIYESFANSCRDAAEGKKGNIEEAQKKIDSMLESKVVGPVEAALLGLQTEGVLWKRGFLSIPRIVPRLVEDMMDLIHHLTALQAAVNSAPEEFGPCTAAVHVHFCVPTHEENIGLLSRTLDLAKACHPILKRGPSPKRKEAADKILGEVAVGRQQVRAHIERLRREARKKSEPPGNKMTAADLLRLGSFMVAISHVMDKMMLIARVILDDSYEARETRISNVMAMDAQRRDLSSEN